MLFALLVFVDQAVKYYISSTLLLGTSIPVFPGVFHITYICNPGAAFGILANQRMIFIVFSIILFFLIVFFYRRLRDTKETAVYSLFMAGRSMRRVPSPRQALAGVAMARAARS